MDVKTAQELMSNKVTVSFLHLRCYINDEAILKKLRDWGVEPVSKIRRRIVPGTEGEVMDGTRYLRVKFNDKVRSLPYSTKLDVVEGVEYFRVLHNNQVPVCIQPGHIFKDCPEFKCYK